MEVRLTPDEEARLAAIAAVLGSDPEQLIKDAALSLLDEDRRFREAEMDARVERMFQS
jgi:hypothetical protein